MFRQDKKRIAAMLAGAIWLCASVQAALAQAPADERPEYDDSEPIEEIIVFGSRPLIGLRWEMYKAEQNFYGAFNDLNSDDMFDVQCLHEATTGSRMGEYTCKANYVREYQSQQNKRRNFGSVYIPEKKINFPEMERQMREEMVALIEEYPELMKAFTDALDAKQAFSSERETRCGDSGLLCNSE